MRLHSKFAVYNTLSKIVIIFVFVIIMPVVVKEVAILNTDRQLREKREQVFSKGNIDQDGNQGDNYQSDQRKPAQGRFNFLNG